MVNTAEDNSSNQLVGNSDTLILQDNSLQDNSYPLSQHDVSTRTAIKRWIKRSCEWLMSALVTNPELQVYQNHARN
ncbi:MAG TPA: hypothetical protein V6D29_13800, partial [Leptolyngbyaceae cyanobacterium]